MSFTIPKSSLLNDDGPRTLVSLSTTINEVASENRELYRIINDARFKKPSGCPDSNIISPGTGCASFPPAEMNTFLAMVEMARRKGLSPLIAERQFSDGSGIFIDVDIHQPSSINVYQYDQGFFSTLIRQLSLIIFDLFDLSKYPKQSFSVGVTYKKHITSKDLNNGTIANSAGFHLLIPGIKLTRGSKKLLFSEIARRGIIPRHIESRGIKTLNPESKYFDQGTAASPSFLVGCARKKDRPAHELMYTFDVEGRTIEDLNVVLNQMIVANNPAVNIVGEFSLNYETEQKLIPKVLIHPSPKWTVAAEKFGIERNASVEDLEADERVLREFDLSTKDDPGLKYMSDVIGLITPDRSFKYADVWPILQTLANMGEKYKVLAEQFLKRYPEKYVNYTAFNKRWLAAISSAAAARSTGQKIYTFKYIEYIARQCNKEKFAALQNDYEVMQIYNLALDPNYVGKFQHAHIAKLLYDLYGNEYVAAYDIGAKIPIWYKMMLPGDKDIKPGEVFKWKMFGSPYPLSQMISTVMYKQFAAVFIKLKEYQEKATQDITTSKATTEYFKGVIKDFKATCNSLMQHGFKQSVIAECAEYFAKRDFIDNLDTDEMIMGVGNGLLKLGANGYAELINYVHDYKVSSSTPVNWKRFDPREEHVKTTILCLRSMFSDEDSDKFELLMNYTCLGLTGKQKPAKMLMLYGAGRNGKSMFMEWLRNVFGEYGGKGSSSLISGITSSSADNASPALYAVKGKRFMSYGECGPNSTLNVQFFKEILGGEKQTARPLYGQLVSFYARCIHLLPLNNLLKIHNTDYATWRRVVLIKHTIKFFNRASPDYDPLNPNHRIQDKYIADPSKLAQDPLYQEALLSFLVYTWEQLQFKYDGDIDKIPHPHVKADTAYYKSTQDVFDDFINRRFVKCNSNPTLRCELSTINLCYTLWMESKGHGRAKGDDIEDKLRDSKIADLMRIDRIGMHLVGYRFLKPTEDLGPAESYVYEVGSLKSTADEDKEKEEAFTEGKVRLTGDRAVQRALEEAKSEMSLIRSETPEQYYERVCREWEQHEQRRQLLGAIPNERKDCEAEEEMRKIEVAEHLQEVDRIRKAASERRAAEEQRQGEKMATLVTTSLIAAGVIPAAKPLASEDLLF